MWRRSNSHQQVSCTCSTITGTCLVVPKEGMDMPLQIQQDPFYQARQWRAATDYPADLLSLCFGAQLRCRGIVRC